MATKKKAKKKQTKSEQVGSRQTRCDEENEQEEGGW